MVSPIVKPKAKKLPKQARGKFTYEKILRAAQDILDEGGIEAMNSNAIVARAGVKAPIFYRYFNDKYDLLLVLAQRLTRVQNEPFMLGIETMKEKRNMESQICAVLNETLKVTEEFTGSVALLSALRALPNLSSIRRDEDDRISRIGIPLLKEMYPKMSKADALRRSMLINEISYSVIEMLIELPKMDRKKVLKDTAHAIVAILDR